MNIEQICDYLNEIGILDINNIRNYLILTTNLLNENTAYKSINEVYKISLFAYIKGINNNDKNLYLLCSNIINSYDRYNLIKKYNIILQFKKLLYYKILQRFNYFIINLFKKYFYKKYINRYNNKNKKNIYNSTYSNRFYNKNKNMPNSIEISSHKDLNSPNKNKTNKLLSNKIPNNINSKNNININNISPIKSINKLIANKRIFGEITPVKKSQKINIDMCINQSNINFEKYFINKRNVICKKCRPSYVESLKNNKKEIYSEYKNPLTKNKSEKKLRIKKTNYEEKTRSKNFENIKPELKRKIQKRAKSKKEDEYWAKKEEDQKYNKIMEKKKDNGDVIYRLYTQKIIDLKTEERKQKKEEKKNLKKSPINWDDVYIQTNNKIIENNKKNNINKKNKTCSYFMPNRGRIYKYVEDEKIDINSNNNVNKNEIEELKNEEDKNNKSENLVNNDENKEEEKINIEENNPPEENKELEEKINDNEINQIEEDKEDKEKEIINKDENNQIIDNNENQYDIKISELKNSSHSEEMEKEKKSIENKENGEQEQEQLNNSDVDFKESMNSIEDRMNRIKNIGISPEGFKSKGLQGAIKGVSNTNPITDLKKFSFNKGIKDSVMFFNDIDDQNNEIINNNNNQLEQINENNSKDKIPEFGDNIDDIEDLIS